MAQIFPKWTNKLPFYLALAGLLFSFLAVGFIWYYFSPKFTAVGYEPEQPVVFSHKLHAGELGMDCRYCHSTVEKASFAALPPTETCYGCHNKVKPQSPRIQPIIESWNKNQPLSWINVHMIPQHSHFPHDAHVNIGVQCQECHGRVDKMDIVQQKEPLSMGWCLQCHANPHEKIVPKKEVTNMLYEKSNLDLEEALKLKLEPPKSDCGACHY